MSEHKSSSNDEATEAVEAASSAKDDSLLRQMRTSEDWWAIWCGGLILIVAFLAVWFNRPDDLAVQAKTDAKIEIKNPLKSWIAVPGDWTASPIEAFYRPATESKPATEEAPATEAKPAFQPIPGILGAFAIVAVLFGIAAIVRTGTPWKFLLAFPIVFLLAVLAYVLAGQGVVKASNLEYVLWALLVGLLVSNSIGTPDFLRPAMLTEFYIKTGLVLLGAEVLMNRLVALGLPGIFVSWVTTPIVLIATYAFGQRILRMESRSLNMVISADMSVCGVSAAIATGAACKAKKEELSLAIGLSLAFTVLMMIAMPIFIRAVGMDEVLAGAWIGGTIDSTGAVAAAGEALRDPNADPSAPNLALETATTVKMVQNILIGVIAFGVAVYWATRVERNPDAAPGLASGLWEVWRRFPKFVLGFAAASIVFSLLAVSLDGGKEMVDATTRGFTRVLREWFFCLAFVSIGLETSFRQLAPYLKGGKPLVLYVCGQALNLCLTLLMAWLMFKVVFRDAIGP